jgi:mannose-6-phosphate isomerase-like protein (cupin superfamily)
MLPIANPQLDFTQAEPIANGVLVHPVLFNSPRPFEATYFQVLPGCETPSDHHPEKECWIVLQGQGILNYEGSLYSLSEKDLFYFDAYKKHQVLNTSEKNLIICSLYWQD